MRWRFVLTMSLSIAFGAASGLPFAAETASGPVKFVSGGVGDESEARIREVSKDFNLRLLFAAKDGHYLADVKVTILDARGARVLDTVSDGPWLLATLAPGKYEITASYAGASVRQATTIPATGRREVIFRWDERS
jgi:hypothetical protein